MAKILEHGTECDGYYVIAVIGGEKRRLHAPRKPDDLKAWVAEAEAQIVQAEASVPSPDSERRAGGTSSPLTRTRTRSRRYSDTRVLDRSNPRVYAKEG